MRKKGEELLLFLFTASVYCFICFYLPYKYPELPKSLSVSVEAVIPGGVSARGAAEIIAKAGAVNDARRRRAAAGAGETHREPRDSDTRLPLQAGRRPFRQQRGGGVISQRGDRGCGKFPSRGQGVAAAKKGGTPDLPAS